MAVVDLTPEQQYRRGLITDRELAALTATGKTRVTSLTIGEEVAHGITRCSACVVGAAEPWKHTCDAFTDDGDAPPTCSTCDAPESETFERFYEDEHREFSVTFCGRCGSEW